MTIKKRLFISNILMLVIPAALAIIVLISCLFILLVSLFPHTEYRLGFHEELTETRYQAVELTADWLSDSDANHKNETESALSQLAEKIKSPFKFIRGRSCFRNSVTQRSHPMHSWNSLWQL